MVSHTWVKTRRKTRREIQLERQIQSLDAELQLAKNAAAMFLSVAKELRQNDSLQITSNVAEMIVCSIDYTIDEHRSLVINYEHAEFCRSLREEFPIVFQNNYYANELADGKVHGKQIKE